MPKQKVKPEFAEERYGVVYFLSHGEMGPVKVGFTTDQNADLRVQQLQVGSPEPLKVVGTVTAYASVERAIHTFLGPHHVRGEWFEREPALLLLSRLQINSTFYRSDFVVALASLLIESGRHDDRSASDVEPLPVIVGRNLIGDWVDQLFFVNTEIPLPFRAWLHAQTVRQDPTGDLARDALADPGFPATGALDRYLEYIVGRSASSAVTRALVDAWIECDMAVASLIVRDEDAPVKKA